MVTRSGSWTPPYGDRTISSLRAVTRLRRPLAILCALLLLTQLVTPALAQEASGSGRSGTGAPPTPPGAAPKVPATPKAPGGEAPQALTSSSTSPRDGGGNAAGLAVSLQAFQNDLFTGAAGAELPIVVPPGTARVAPKVVLRYNSGTVDDLDPRQQGPWTGLGWMLDTGGYVVRDTTGTAGTSDDTFRLFFNGASYDLVLIDGVQRIYRTKDETFWKVQYDIGTDSWRLWTKDGTVHRFGLNPDSRAATFSTDLSTTYTYKYLLDEVLTTTGTAVRYTYTKHVAHGRSGWAYDQAVYPDTITYTYANGSPVGDRREVKFVPDTMERTDYTDTTATTEFSYFEKKRLGAIEVRVGTSLVRKYTFAYDYSVDRDPAYTWGGGATGDLTLLSVTQAGTNGTSTLPPATFTYYASGRLATATNGLGGTVSYDYEHVSSLPLRYAITDTSGACYYDLGMVTDLFTYPANPACANVYFPGGIPFSAMAPLGYVLQAQLPGTIPLYRVIKGADAWYHVTFDWGVSLSPDTGVPAWNPYSALLGFIFPSTPPQGTFPLYVWLDYICNWIGCPSCCYCVDYMAYTQPCAPCAAWNPFLGYLYAGKVDRYRVTARSQNDGRGTVATMTYAYSGLGLSADGKEYRGHAWVRATDPAGHYTDTWFHQDDALKGRAAQSESRSGTATLFAKVVNTWTTSAPFPGVTFAKLARTDTYSCDGDTTCRNAAQTFEYENVYGNLTQTKYLGDVAETGDERTEVTEYAPNATTYVVGLPTHSSTLNAADATVAQAWFYYDGATSHTTPPTQGRLTKKCQWLNGGTNPCVQMAYDTYGNVTSTTDARGKTATIEYDTTYQTFPVRVTTPGTPNVPGGLVTASTYDERFGAVLTTTDPNNATTTNHYDVFGRLDWTRNALTETTTIAYEDLGTVGSQRITTRLPDGSSGGLWSEEYFDGLGRTFQVRKKAPAGRVIVLETRFDTRGSTAQTSLPRFDGANAVWTSFTYDALARPTLTTFPDTTTAQVAYNDWTITTTDRNGRVRITVKDAYSRTVQITEPGGVITRYAYDAMGRLAAVTDAANNVTTVAYDTLGRKVQMTEPNMGTWSYTYDPNGNLLTQTDAKGQVVTFTYDALNRVATNAYTTLATVPLNRAVKSWVEGYAALYRGGICVANSGGTCVGGDVRLDAGLGAFIGYLKVAPETGTVAAYNAACYADTGGTCTGWDLGLTASGTAVGYLATSPPSGNVPLTQSGGLLYQGLGGTPSAYVWTAPSGTAHTDHYYAPDTVLPSGYVSEGLTGYLRPYGETNTVALVRYVNSATGSHYYSATADAPSGYAIETVLGYLETTTAPDVIVLARHYKASTGDYVLTTSTTPPAGYVYQGTLGYLRTQPTAPGGTIVFTYDTGTNGKGRRTAMADFAGSVSYGYDILGRATSATRVTDVADGGVSYATQMTYNSVGQVATMTYADNETVSYTYDAGQVYSVGSSIGGATAYVASTAYGAAGHVTQRTLGNGAVTSYSYHATTLRLTGVATAKDSATLQALGYSYDNVGNITAITDTRTPANNQTFQYDALDRLITATGSYGTQAYTYNALGNILSKAGVNYSYGATGRTCGRVMPHAVTSTSDGRSYSYDCNGNTVSDGDRTFTWDANNKPFSVTRGGVGTTTFGYSGDGARVRKQGPAGLIRYAGGLEDHVTDVVKVKHIVAGGLRIATRVTGGPNAGVYFPHADHLGSLNVLTTSTGTEVQRLTYRPFGETHSNTGSLDFDRHRFTGQEEDPETGLYFYQARYYNPVLGRFLSPDSVVPGAGNSQNLNRFSYVANNPVNLIDPSGHNAWKTLGNVFNTISNIGRGVAILMVGSAIGSGVSSALAGAGGVVSGAAGGAASGAFVSIASGSNESPLIGAATGALSGGIAGYFGNTYSLTRVGAESVVGGINARIRGDRFERGATFSLMVSGLTHANHVMRGDQVGKSLQEWGNASGISEGLDGDGFKLAGARAPISDSCAAVWFGGCQGGQGYFLGQPYSPGSYYDKIDEAFAGPHDFFRDMTGAYEANGNARQFNGFQGFLQDNVLLGATLLPAAPFGAAALLPSHMYDRMRTTLGW